MAKTIQQTKELIMFGVRVAKVLGDDLKDGKVSIIEMLGLVKLIGPLQEALSGAQEIPAELLDIDGSEAEELITAIKEAVGDHLTTESAKQIAQDSFESATTLLKLLATIRHTNPPKAQVVT